MKQTNIHDFVGKPKKPAKFTKPFRFKINVRPNKGSASSSSGSTDSHNNKST